MLTDRAVRILQAVSDSHGKLTTREIGLKVGSLNHLTEHLDRLRAWGYLVREVVGNRHYHSITRKGLQVLRECKTSDVAEDLAELHKILSGRLVVKGDYRFELREDGTVQKFSMRNPDGTWWVKDQRTKAEKERDKV